MAKTAAAKPTAAVAAPKDEKDVVSDASESEQPKPKAKRAPANGVKKAKNTSKYYIVNKFVLELFCAPFFTEFSFSFLQNQTKLIVFFFFCFFSFQLQNQRRRKQVSTFLYWNLPLDVWQCVRLFYIAYYNKIIIFFFICHLSK